MDSETTSKALQFVESTAREQWPKYVAYIQVDAVVGLVFGTFLAILSIVVFDRLGKKQTSGGEAEFFKYAGLGLVLVALAVGVSCILSCAATLVSPEGSAIRTLLSSAGKR